MVMDMIVLDLVAMNTPTEGTTAENTVADSRGCNGREINGKEGRSNGEHIMIVHMGGSGHGSGGRVVSGTQKVQDTSGRGCGERDYIGRRQRTKLRGK